MGGSNGNANVRGISVGGVDLESNREWEFLEALVGGGGGDGSDNLENVSNSSVRRRMIMTDILGGTSVRIALEREERRRKERGRRFVGALKETSMVSVSKLIPLQ